MNHHAAYIFLCVTIPLIFLSFSAVAQERYEEGTRPSIEIDRSVLDELGDGDEDNNQRTKITLSPPAPAIPAITVDRLLNAPTNTGRVTTEVITPPASIPEPVTLPLSLPVPEKPKPVFAKPIIDEPKPKAKPTPKISQKPKEKPKKSAQPKKEPKKEMPPPVTLPPEVMKPKVSNPKPSYEYHSVPKALQDLPRTKQEKVVDAYRPKTPKTMPSIPSVSVEKAPLPPVVNGLLPSLPPITIDKAVRPTIGERMMDAALERHMETDIEVIQETLEKKKTTPQKTASKPKFEVIKNTRPQQKNHLANNSVKFEFEQTALTADQKKRIKDVILPTLKLSPAARVQILSFAASPDASDRGAEAVSLNRAIAVRDYLISLKIQDSRLDIRPLGNKGGFPHPDRVDFVLLK